MAHENKHLTGEELLAEIFAPGTAGARGDWPEVEIAAALGVFILIDGPDQWGQTFQSLDESHILESNWEVSWPDSILCPKFNGEASYRRVEIPRFKWTVEIEIDPVWVGDGFDVTEYVERNSGGPDALIEIGEQAKWWRFEEATVKVIAAPNQDDIRQAQGYSAKEEGGAK